MIELRQAQNSEADIISELACKTFVETFAIYNTPEDMNAFLTAALSPERFALELASPDSDVYIAAAHEKPVGYLQLNYNTTEKGLEGIPVVEIGRLYVMREFIGLKIGKLLMEKAIAIANNRNASYLWLGVWEHNYRAIAFYTKWGFAIFGSHVFQLGSDAQIDLLMRKHITLNTHYERSDSTQSSSL